MVCVCGSDFVCHEYCSSFSPVVKSNLGKPHLLGTKQNEISKFYVLGCRKLVYVTGAANTFANFLHAYLSKVLTLVYLIHITNYRIALVFFQRSSSRILEKHCVAKHFRKYFRFPSSCIFSFFFLIFCCFLIEIRLIPSLLHAPSIKNL